MFSRIQIREIIAWMTLVVAIILFGVTITFAQTKSININNENGKVHIKIHKEENGNSIDIDTTFQSDDDVDLEKVIKDLGYDDDNLHLSASGNKHAHININDNDGSSHKKKHVTMDFDVPEFSDSDMEKLHENISESMEKFRDSMEKMKESIHSMHIKIDDDSMQNDFHFNFNFPDKDSVSEHHGKKKCYAYSYSFDNSDDLDSLKDKSHIIIVGGKDENAPVLEKVIKSKNGKQIFIYKRSDTSVKAKEKSKDSSRENKNLISGMKDLSYYPNPSSGKFTLHFNYEKENDVNIKILDSNSKAVFSEKLNDFSGEYSKEIDLSGKSKGNYIIRITAGNQSMTKKIVLN
jgi:hypothetical protein